jgi:hypothetical protein
MIGSKSVLGFTSLRRLVKVKFSDLLLEMGKCKKT